MTNDTSLGVMRNANAGYPEALDEAQRKSVKHFRLGEGYGLALSTGWFTH